jgi:uncharacterized membrane protein
MANFSDLVIQWTEIAIIGIEFLAVIIISVTIIAATVQFLVKRLSRRGPVNAYHKYRVGLARAILLGLEVLIAADVVRTVVLDSTFQSIAILGLLVLVRTFLSLVLVVEIDKRWPWQAKNGKAGQEEEEET